MHTILFASALRHAGLDDALYQVGHAHGLVERTAGFPKEAGTPVRVHALSGRLYVSKSGWVLLDVPNAIVRGLHKALDEPGVELPPSPDGQLNGHVSVLRPEEVATAKIDLERLQEKGKHFHYSLGAIETVEPAGWSEMSRVWFARVHSPELSAFRRSYGLSSLPDNDTKPFHATFAVRRKKVLQDSDVSKAAADKAAGDDRARKLRHAVASMTDKELDGIRLLYHPEPPQVWLDVMDWGDGKVGDRLEATAKELGCAVERVNEGMAPQGSEWVKLADAKERKIPTVAVDLDGTICTYDKGWQGEDHFGAVRPGAKKALEEFQRRGYRIIIWTTRGNKDKVRKYLFDNEIPHHYVNENPDQPEGSSGKVIADVYLDDRGIAADGPWKAIAAEAVRRLEKAFAKEAAQRKERNTLGLLAGLGGGAAALGGGTMLADKALDYHPEVLAEIERRVADVSQAQQQGGDTAALASYLNLGSALNQPAYGSRTPLDIMHNTRTPGTLLHGLATLSANPMLGHSWDAPAGKADPTMTKGEHYTGYAGGPVSALRTALRESYPPGDTAHANVEEHLLGHAGGGDAATLPAAEQEQTVKDVLAAPEQAGVVGALTEGGAVDHPNIAKAYRLMARVVGAPGEAVEALKPYAPYLLGGGAALAGGAGLLALLHRHRQQQRRTKQAGLLDLLRANKGRLALLGGVGAAAGAAHLSGQPGKYLANEYTKTLDAVQGDIGSRADTLRMEQVNKAQADIENLRKNELGLTLDQAVGHLGNRFKEEVVKPYWPYAAGGAAALAGVYGLHRLLSRPARKPEEEEEPAAV